MFDKAQLTKDMAASNDDQNYKNLVTYLRQYQKQIDSAQGVIDTVMKKVEEAKTTAELRTIYQYHAIAFS